VGDSCLNSQINLFDPVALETGNNPWSVLLGKAVGNDDWAPGVREYTRVFVLPVPVQREGSEFDVLLMGKKGRVVLLSTVTGRTFRPANGLRPGSCQWDRSDQSTFIPLLHRGGEILIIGGGSCDELLSRADFYNVQSDSWTSLELGIRRRVPSAVFLADGSVLVASGEPVGVDQNRFAKRDAAHDTRYMQIIYPVSKSFVTETARGTVYRGYHNMAALLADGSVLIGGGYSQYGDVGCEEPNLQIFGPSYLAERSSRPLLADERQVIELLPGGNVTLKLKRGSAAATAASLVAVQAFTHSYGQNQRFVPLKVVDLSDLSITVKAPESPVLFAGHYSLFLLGRNGAPSRSLHVRVLPSLRQTERSVLALERELRRVDRPRRR